MKLAICQICVHMILINCLIAQQNLVPNPSFEDTLSCPYYYNQLYKSIGWESYRDSPDYFNSCNLGYVGVPDNDIGFQSARTGSAYAGFLSYARFAANGREILGIELNNFMIIGQKYIVTFYVSMAIGSGQSVCGIATNKLGVRFSTIPFSNSSPAPINNFAHIYTDSVISDTSNWVEISGSFTADSMYQYIGIGNYFQDNVTTNIIYDSLAGFAYYYIDDVSVILDSEDVSVQNNSTGIIISSIFPNPATNYLKIIGKGLQSCSLMSLMGDVKLKVNFYNSDESYINVSNLKRGVYFLKIESNNIAIIRKIILTN